MCGHRARQAGRFCWKDQKKPITTTLQFVSVFSVKLEAKSLAKRMQKGNVEGMRGTKHLCEHEMELNRKLGIQ